MVRRAKPSLTINTIIASPWLECGAISIFSCTPATIQLDPGAGGSVFEAVEVEAKPKAKVGALLRKRKVSCAYLAMASPPAKRPCFGVGQPAGELEMKAAMDPNVTTMVVDPIIKLEEDERMAMYLTDVMGRRPRDPLVSLQMTPDELGQYLEMADEFLAELGKLEESVEQKWFEEYEAGGEDEQPGFIHQEPATRASRRPTTRSMTRAGTAPEALHPGLSNTKW